MEELSLKEILDYLNGSGLVITNWDLIEENLKEIEYTLDSFVRDNQ